jgi:hypothetical protein
MRRWIGGFLLAVLAACLFGCSASGPRFSEMAQSLPSLGENQGRIYFYRTSIMGMAVQPDVTVNGQTVGKSQPGSFFFIDRPAGTYRASARTEAEGTIDITLRPKQTAYILMSIGGGFVVGRPEFERVAESEGRKELPSLAYGGSVPVSTKTAAAASPAPVAGAPVAAATAATPTSPPATSPPAPPTLTTASSTRNTAPAPTDATPFSKTSINDLRLLLQANR